MALRLCILLYDEAKLTYDYSASAEDIAVQFCFFDYQLQVISRNCFPPECFFEYPRHRLDQRLENVVGPNARILWIPESHIGKGLLCAAWGNQNLNCSPKRATGAMIPSKSNTLFLKHILSNSRVFGCEAQTDLHHFFHPALLRSMQNQPLPPQCSSVSKYSPLECDSLHISGFCGKLSSCLMSAWGSELHNLETFVLEDDGLKETLFIQTSLDVVGAWILNTPGLDPVPSLEALEMTMELNQGTLCSGIPVEVRAGCCIERGGADASDSSGFFELCGGGVTSDEGLVDEVICVRAQSLEDVDVTVLCLGSGMVEFRLSITLDFSTVHLRMTVLDCSLDDTGLGPGRGTHVNFPEFDLSGLLAMGSGSGPDIILHEDDVVMQMKGICDDECPNEVCVLENISTEMWNDRILLQLLVILREGFPCQSVKNCSKQCRIVHSSCRRTPLLFFRGTGLEVDANRRPL
ncbi:hypothetical protein Tco_0471752 [Tanacetum coccineum]